MNMNPLLRSRHRQTGDQFCVAMSRLQVALRKFNPGQPRVPPGRPEGGQWSRGSSESEAALVSGSDYSSGDLIAELPFSGGGRFCVYRFDFADVIVAGPNIARCQPWIFSSAAVHGLILNDNWRKSLAA
jgi:hypothetical protein